LNRSFLLRRIGFIGDKVLSGELTERVEVVPYT
jgi:hypothetical protein